MSLNHSGSWSSATSDTSVETPAPCELIDGVPLDWSGRGTSHVDYSRSDALPLAQGRFLGYGMHGGVYETTCNGVALAWKRKYCSRRVGHRERREIEIIKRLEHKHIVRLVGTYIHGPFLGLLLWPVAICDLANLIEDIDWLQKPSQNEDLMQTDDNTTEDTLEQINERQSRLQALGFSTASLEAARIHAVAFLEKTMGCIASAVTYLHKQEIKHKDLKPSNILLSSDGLWVTDFGTATDFSVLTTSATEDGERGTPKYFAPEIAVYAPSGRAADIFSMGCIFLEIITLCVGYSLAETMQLRSQNDKSFHANLDNIEMWFSRGRIACRSCGDEHMMGLVRQHQSFRKSHYEMGVDKHPFEFHGRGWGSFDISVYLVLRPGSYWDWHDARPVPGENYNRMLPLFWGLTFGKERTETQKTVAVRSMR
ncbi:kinase-like domain-containing protein [Phaeosphaeria sp. MPI-PUGE-AT-0046c]|nr:kinase-like domain-containing protein [Phaeosphaeria sp. MPI-PUGE-AT-0046c]